MTSQTDRAKWRQSGGFSLAGYYSDKYGDRVIEKLEQEAAFCEAAKDMSRRNRLLRIRDEILLAEFPLP
jgi:hypothetical protein